MLRGPSGSGKSTLLSLLAGILKAQSGSVRVLGHDLGALTGSARDRFRADHIGVIFQLFNLIPYLSVRENVSCPAPSRAAAATAASNPVPVSWKWQRAFWITSTWEMARRCAAR